MLTDPTSGSLQLTETLPRLPVSDYILPGIFLLIVMVPGLRRFYAKM